MSTTVKQHDTWPPVKGTATDSAGPVDLSTALELKFIAKGGTVLIEGDAEAIWPVDADGFNWSYTFAEGDTDVPDTYRVELEVHWAADKVETFPNTGTETLIIEPDQG